jgi:hypothetical protein
MLFDTPVVSPEEFEDRSGWHLQPEGLCRDDVCVPLPPDALCDNGYLDLAHVGSALHMPVVDDASQHLWALGPPAGASVLTSAQAPDLVLPDVHGRPLALSSLLGRKVLLLVWASW